MPGTTLLVSWLSMAASGAEVPEITRPVTDLAEALSPADEDAISRQLVAHREATGVQLAVLLLPSTHPEDIADFSQRVFEGWGGGTAGRDDGALFVLAIEDRRSRLHLGYGLEPVIPDAAAKQMLDLLRPELQGKRYGDATNELVADFRRRTAHLRPGSAIGMPLGSAGWLWFATIALGTILGIVWGLLVRRALRIRAGQHETSSKARLDGSWTERLRAAIAAAARDGRVRIGVAAIAIIQASIVVGVSEGGFGWAYSLLLWLSLTNAWIMAGTRKVVSIPFGIATGVAFIVAVASLDAGAPVPDGDAVMEAALPALAIGVLFLGMGFFFVYCWKRESSGGSSYSSRTSSSSSSSSSRSSSSSSYSGGGGRSGGGGASSSW
jgi:uncharacterized protein